MSTQTIILMGVVFSMFATSIISLLTAFSGEKLRSITFWTMGSLSGAGYTETLVLLGALAVFGGVLLSCADELNAFSLGEDAARHMGVAVGPVKLGVLVCVASLIGVCVSVGGSIGFVGLIDQALQIHVLLVLVDTQMGLHLIHGDEHCASPHSSGALAMTPASRRALRRRLKSSRSAATVPASLSAI